MAVKNICDIKSCEQVIKGTPHRVSIIDKVYDMCQECFDGLNKFIEQNLNPGTDQVKAVADAIGKSLKEMMQTPPMKTGFALPPPPYYLGQHQQLIPNDMWNPQPNIKFYGLQTTTSIPQLQVAHPEVDVSVDQNGFAKYFESIDGK